MSISEICRSRLTRRSALGLATALLVFRRSFALGTDKVDILVHLDPNCGCCSGWVRHRLGVPVDLAACHTAEVNGYVIEGHVPAAAIRRLLAERPTASGLAVPGMPVGSPGMEGGVPEKYEVVLFGTSGRQTFMRFLGANVVG